MPGYTKKVLYSDRDIRAAIDAGDLIINPFDPELVQPSSVDVRMDRHFRVFNNSKYTHIDPKQQQDDLTSMVEVAEDEPFVLHPGEFVLGSTLERFALPAHMAGRLEGKSSLAGVAHAFDRRVCGPGLFRPHHPGVVECGQSAHHVVAGHEGRPVGAVQNDKPRRNPIWFQRAGFEVSRPRRSHAVARLSEFFLTRLSTPSRGGDRGVEKEHFYC